MDRDYEIGGHCFRVTGEKWLSALDATTAFNPFIVNGVGERIEFVFREGNRESVPTFDTVLYSFRYEDIDSFFGLTTDGYLLRLCPVGEECLNLWIKYDSADGYLYGNCSLRLLRFALWIGYGVMTVGRSTVAVHSSCIVYREKAVLFLGESGTGKSTHTRLWQEHIVGSRLLNDDSPVLRVENGAIEVYGSPWSGKTPCYKAEHYPLAACVRLSQAPSNEIRRLNTMQGFAALHPSAPPVFAYDGRLYDGICDIMSELLSSVPVYQLACLPDREAAELACRTLFAE